MLQAIKAVADFPNVVYLLAYDVETLAHAVERALGVKDGRAYLEKVVQLPVRLPELPARRIQHFAEVRIGTALAGCDRSNKEAADRRTAVSIAAALTQTPRDVARLRTVLQLRCPPLSGEVNVADIAVAEAILLKVPEFLPWICNNKDWVLTLGLSRFDAVQDVRGMHDQKTFAAALPEDLYKQEREEKLNQLKSLGCLSDQERGAYQRALRYLFDEVDSVRVNNGERPDYLRLQRFRHFYRWQCLCDSQEPIDVSQLQAWATNPMQLLMTTWTTSPESFRSVAALLCDLSRDGQSSIPAADSMAWVELFGELERSLGADFLVGRDMGFGPGSLLAAMVRLDEPEQRVVALLQVIKVASTSLGCTLLMHAFEDLKSPEKAVRRSNGRSLVNTQGQVDTLVAALFRRVEAELLEGTWSRSPVAMEPYVVLSRMAMAGQPKASLAALARNCLERHPNLATSFFGSALSGTEEEHATYTHAVNWDVLPDAQWLLRSLEPCEQFSKSHPFLLKQIERRSMQLNPPLAPDPV
jgi:hypothetical protein